jgi:predicted nucleotidyltransferase
MKQSIEIMRDAIIDILDNNAAAIYLYGSVALNDFKLGWSDIDILCLTQTTITDEQAGALVSLRQDLLEKDLDNPYYRLFEGAILPLNTFINNSSNKVVYWGTSGQKITDTYSFDSFSKYELLTSGILLSGHDEREKIRMPLFSDLRNDVIYHYHTIRKYAVKTNESIYSCGWLLDIARGIYTLRTGKVIAKTAAGTWALKNDICPVAESLSKAIEVRNNPLYYKNTDSYKKWAATLGSEIQIFADILEHEIDQAK